MAVAGTVLIVAAVLAVAALTRLDADAPAQQSALPSESAERAPVLDTTFEHFDGRVVRLSDWSGTPMVVNFWASWCAPCVDEMSAVFEPLHKRLGDQVTFIGLNLQDDADNAVATARQTGVTYDLGRDPAGELFAGFDGFGMPTTVFVDASGVVTDTHTGALSRDQLEELIASSFGVSAPRT